jgi:hypothetical protein
MRVIQELEQRICRCASRVELFGGGDEKVAEYGHEGMAGLLVEDAYEFLLSRRVPGLPTRTQLSSHLDPPVRLNVLSKFLGGAPPRGTDWFRHARTILRYLLLGDNPDVRGQRVEVAERIDDYFFRNFKAKESTPFFRRSRRQYGMPCSQKELAGEIAWIVRERDLTGQPAELLWVSGGLAYFPSGVDTRLAREVVLALRGEVRVTFVYYPDIGRHGPRANLDDFFSNNQEAKDTPYLELDLMKATNVNRWWEFSGVTFTYLYLAASRGTETFETLYCVRGAQSGPLSDELLPLALRANADELDTFMKWWARVKHLATVNTYSTAAPPGVARTERMQAEARGKPEKQKKQQV